MAPKKAPKKYNGPTTFPGRKFANLTAQEFESHKEKRGIVNIQAARDRGCYVDTLLAYYPTFKQADEVVLICGFYLAYISARLVLRMARPLLRTLTEDAITDYVSKLSVTILDPKPWVEKSKLFMQVRAAAMAFLSLRCILSDYVETARRAPVKKPLRQIRLTNFSNMLVVGANRHLHDIRKGDSRDRPVSVVVKRSRDGSPRFDLSEVPHLAPTDAYWWECELAWQRADTLLLSIIVVCLTITRSKPIMSKLARHLEQHANPSENSVKELLLPEAYDTSWKPKNSTYDTSTCNLGQDPAAASYGRSIWKIVAAFVGIFASGARLPCDLSDFLADVVGRLQGVSFFRGQHLIGNLALLQFRFPKECWKGLLPEGLFAFVDERKPCSLADFQKIVSRQNTLAIIRFFFTRKDKPVRLANGMLNLHGEVVTTDSPLL